MAVVAPALSSLSRLCPPPPQVFTLDHDIQNTTPKNLKKYAEIAAFAQEHGVDAYPAGRGIGHQPAGF